MNRSGDISRDSLNIPHHQISDSNKNELEIFYDNSTKDNIDAINESAESVDEIVEGGKLISSQVSNSSESVVFLTPHGNQSSEEHSASVEFLKIAEGTDEGIVFRNILGKSSGEYAESVDTRKEENEAVAPQSSKPFAPSLETKKKGEGLKKFVEKAKEKAKAAVDQVKAAKEERATTKAAAEVKQAVENYFNIYKDKMFDKTNSAYQAYFKLLGFNIDEVPNPGMELGRFKEYVTTLILENKIKKSDLSPQVLNRILTELINKKVESQKDDRIKGVVSLIRLQSNE